MNVRIRNATEKDFSEIFSLIKELAEFENAFGKVTNSIEQMTQEKDLFKCLVAENEKGEIIGMALFFFAYFTWVGKSLYLDDIYVKKQYRNQKIGTALLKKVFEIARDENCKRVRWQVLKWNQAAIKMYSKYGAVIDDEWLNCTFDHEGIINFQL